MIKNRPESHGSLPHYRGLPELPYQVEEQLIPEAIRHTVLGIRHVEPISSTTAELNGKFIGDNPSDAEARFYREHNTQFQLVFVVINSIFRKRANDVSALMPYAISLIPASKREVVQTCSADFAIQMCGAPFLERGTAYLGLDPFEGSWSLWSQVGLIAEMGSQTAFTDELGLVHDFFFLRTDLSQEEIIQPGIDMPPARLKNYLRHRSRLLYTPFTKLRSRLVWGVENALELFVLHEFVRRGWSGAIPQALLFDDGTWYPSLYHSWQEFTGDDGTGFISNVDFYFPDKKVAVFCDGATHSRAKIKARDAGIDTKLNSLGIASVRLRSNDILNDVVASVDRVSGAL